MYEIPEDQPTREKGFEPVAIKKYQETRGNDMEGELHWVGIDTFRIGKGGDTLFTDGLNACTGVAISTKNLTFAAHYSYDQSPGRVANSIRNKISKEEIQTASVKVCLGSWDQESKSLTAALKLLYDLGLLDKFIAKVQDFLIQCKEVATNEKMDINSQIFSMANIPQLLWTNINRPMALSEFLKLEHVAAEFQIHRIALFLNRIKETFVHAKECPLEKIEFEDIVSTADSLSLQNSRVPRNEF